MTFDGKAFGKDIVETVKGHIDKTVAPLLSEIAALKAEVATLKAMPAPKDGKDSDPNAIAGLVAAGFTPDIKTLQSELATLKDATASMGAAIAAHGNAIEAAVKASDVDAKITKAVGAIPPAPELPDVAAMIAEAIEAAMPEPVDVKALVIEAVAALPPAKDGEPGAKGDVGGAGPAGAPGLHGKDGVSLAGAMIDRTGALILTLSDGTTRELGHVVGKDVDMVAVEGMVDRVTHKAIAEAWAAIPEPKDGERGPQGEPGKSITVEDIAPLIETAVAKHIESIKQTVPEVVKSAVSAIPIPQAPQLPDIDAMVTKAVMALPPAQNGKDADPALVQSLVKETVERAVAALPVAKDGKSVTIDDVRPLIEDAVTKAVTLIPVPKDGIDGKSVTLNDVQPLIMQEITKAVSEIPVPKDGQDGAHGVDGKDGANGHDGKDGVTLDDLRPVIDETVAKSISAIPVPKDGKDGRDGLDVKDLLVVEGGELVATFTDGRTKVLGQFRGKDGDPGKDGADGANGKDGADGLGFDDCTEELEDEGRIIVRQFFHAGKLVKESRITTKMAIFRGVHDPARTYQPGDMVSRGGSQWHCNLECKGPFNGDFWTLSVKQGRDRKPD